MEKEIREISGGHELVLKERKRITLTGVIKIDSFDEEEFLLETNMGYLVIKGSGLEIVKLDTKDGIVAIKGTFISMAYLDDLKHNKKQSSLFDKLFK